MKALIVLSGAVGLLLGPAAACTFVKMQASGEFQGPIIGHAMEEREFGSPVDWSIVVRPSGTSLANTEGLTGVGPVPPELDLEVRYTTKLTFVALAVSLSKWSGYTAGFGGMNEAGLSISSLRLIRAQYQPLTPGKRNVFAWSLTEYLLAHFGTVDEVESALTNDLAVVGLGLPGSVIGVHWAVTDPTGRSVVIEYISGVLNIFNNSVGVMTNDPHFPWHVESLNYYGFVKGLVNTTTGNSDIAVNTGDLLPGQDTVPYVANVGLNFGGLPGDGSPTSRFVRMFFLKQYAILNTQPKTKLEWITQAQALITAGHMVSGTMGDGPGPIQSHDHTIVTMLYLPLQRHFIVRTYFDMRWKLIDLSATFDKELTWPITFDDNGITNVTDLFQAGLGWNQKPSLLSRRQRRRPGAGAGVGVASGDEASMLQSSVSDAEPWEGSGEL